MAAGDGGTTAMRGRGAGWAALATLLGVLLTGATHRPASPVLWARPCAHGAASLAALPPGKSSLHMTARGGGWALAGGRVLHTSDGGRGWCDVTPTKGRTTRQLPTLVPDRADFLDGRQAWLADSQLLGDEVWLLHTQDGGHSWQAHEVPVDTRGAVVSVRQLDFLNNRQGWMLIGASGGPIPGGVAGVTLLYRTDNGGVSWAPASEISHRTYPPGTMPPPGQIEGMRFLDPSTGWATAGTVGDNGPFSRDWLLSTVDAGATWNAVPTVPPAAYPYPQASTLQVHPGAPEFFSPSQGILPVRLGAFGSPDLWVFYRTSDGGATWAAGTPVPGRRHEAFAFWAPNDGVVLADDGTWQRTRDGGQSWTRTPAPVPAVRALDLIAPQLGWLLDTRGNLWQSTDGGAHWVRVSGASGATQPPGPAAWIPASLRAGFASLASRLACRLWLGCGMPPRPTSLCVRPETPLLHRLWTDLHPSPPPFAELEMATAEDGWALAGGRLLHTTDGGGRWVDATPGGCLLSTLDVLGPNTLWVAAAADRGRIVTTFATTDAGWRWWHAEVAVPTSASQPVLRFRNARQGTLTVPLAARGVVEMYHSNDGGLHWAAGGSVAAPRPAPPTLHLTSLDQLGGTLEFALAGESLGLSSDGGAHWSVVYRGQDLEGARLIDFLSPEQGWAVVVPGGPGYRSGSTAPWRLLETADGGRSWRLISGFGS